jgi:hypothetical protein
MLNPCAQSRPPHRGEAVARDCRDQMHSPKLHRVAAGGTAEQTASTTTPDPSDRWPTRRQPIRVAVAGCRRRRRTGPDPPGDAAAEYAGPCDEVLVPLLLLNRQPSLERHG